MSLKEELLLDFDLRMPRILVNGTQGIIDNVKRLVLLSDESIIVSCGKQYISVRGKRLSITFLEDERMFIKGTIEAAEFYGETDGHE